MIGDPLATGTEVIEIVGGPFDSRRMAVPSPPPTHLRVPIAPSLADLVTLDREPTPIDLQVAELTRGAMNDQGVWRYHWSEPS